MDPDALTQLPLEKVTAIGVIVIIIVGAMVFVVLRNNRIIEKLVDLIERLTTGEKK